MEQAHGAAGRRVSAAQFDSYHSLTPKELGAKQQMVMNCFDSNNRLLTREDIAALTNLRLSSVCGRVRELLDAKRLKVFGLRRCAATGKCHELIGIDTDSRT